MEAHLRWWQREIADRRRHGTTGEVPLHRFAREAECLRPCAGRPPFGQLRDLIRTVHADCAVVVDTNAYSVPWRLIGERVRVVVNGGRVRVHHGPEVVAEHDEHAGRHGRVVDRAHLVGVNGGPRPAETEATRAETGAAAPARGLYAAVAGGQLLMAGVDHRHAGRLADPTAVDGDPGPARQPARRGRGEEADAARVAGDARRAGGRAQGRTPHRDGVQDRALPDGPRARRLRLQGAAERRPASGTGAGDVAVGGAR